MGWTIGAIGFDSRRGLGIFLFTAASRTALRPIQPPIQRVPGALSLGIKQPGREADRLPPSSAEVKECVELYLHSPSTSPWRGAQFKKAQGQIYLYLYIPVTIAKFPWLRFSNTRVYPKVSGLAAWSQNCKWYSSLPLSAVVSLFCESV
jgi:hypothetical protein